MDMYVLKRCESQSSCCLGGHVLAAVSGWGWEVLTGTGDQWRFLQWKWERHHSLYSYREARCSGPNVFFFFFLCGRPLWSLMSWLVLASFLLWLFAFNLLTGYKQTYGMAGVSANTQPHCSSVSVCPSVTALIRVSQEVTTSVYC